MFRAHDDIEERHEKIRSFLKDDPVVAVLLAAADFEWCINRFIIAVGNRPNIEIRDTVLSQLTKHGGRRYVSGMDGSNGYTNAWLKANNPKATSSIQDIIGAERWIGLKDALQLRHEIIHGRRGTVGSSYAKLRVNMILAASVALNNEAVTRKKRIYGGKLSVKKTKK